MVLGKWLRAVGPLVIEPNADGPSVGRKVFAMQSGSGILHGTRSPPSGLAWNFGWMQMGKMSRIVRCDMLDMYVYIFR